MNFLGGDPDRPVIVGQLYNQMAEPPALSIGGDLPGNRYLSGMKSREVGGIRANQLQFDDTPGEISTRLSSDHAQSELNLGFLTNPRRNGAGESRGQGAELKSDKTVVVRGSNGVLISASGFGSSDRTLLSRDELIAGAELAEQIGQQLSDLTQKHSEDAADGNELKNLVQRIEGWHEKASTDAGKSIIALSAPSGTFIGSQDALALSARSSVDVLSGGDSRVSAGGNLAIRTTRALSLFAFRLGIKIIAASGGIRVQSQDGDIEISSSKKIKIIANDVIELHAPNLKFVAQGCQVDYGGGTAVQQSAGVHTIKSSKFVHQDGSGGSPEKMDLPSTEVEHDQQVLVTVFGSEKAIPNKKYRITVEDGNVVEGVTDSEGLTKKFKTKLAFATYQIELLD